MGRNNFAKFDIFILLIISAEITHQSILNTRNWIKNKSFQIERGFSYQSCKLSEQLADFAQKKFKVVGKFRKNIYSSKISFGVQMKNIMLKNTPGVYCAGVFEFVGYAHARRHSWMVLFSLLILITRMSKSTPSEKYCVLFLFLQKLPKK